MAADEMARPLGPELLASNVRRWQMGRCSLTPRECRVGLAELGLTRAEIDEVMRLVDGQLELLTT